MKAWLQPALQAYSSSRTGCHQQTPALRLSATLHVTGVCHATSPQMASSDTSFCLFRTVQIHIISMTAVCAADTSPAICSSSTQPRLPCRTFACSRYQTRLQRRGCHCDRGGQHSAAAPGAAANHVGRGLGALHRRGDGRSAAGARRRSGASPGAFDRSMAVIHRGHKRQDNIVSERPCLTPMQAPPCAGSECRRVCHRRHRRGPVLWLQLCRDTRRCAPATHACCRHHGRSSPQTDPHRTEPDCMAARGCTSPRHQSSAVPGIVNN